MCNTCIVQAPCWLLSASTTQRAIARNDLALQGRIEIATGCCSASVGAIAPNRCGFTHDTRNIGRKKFVIYGTLHAHVDWPMARDAELVVEILERYEAHNLGFNRPFAFQPFPQTSANIPQRVARRLKIACSTAESRSNFLEWIRVSTWCRKLPCGGHLRRTREFFFHPSHIDVS